MQILFLSRSAHLPQLVGGAQWSTHYFARGLQRLGHSVSVLAALQDSGWLGLQNKVRRRVGGAPCPVDQAMGYPTGRGWDLSRGLRESVARMRPDVVVVTGIGSAPVPLAAEALAMGLPVVYLVMDVGFERHGGPLTDLDGAMFISNSEFTARRLFEAFALSSIVIRPPVRTSRCAVRGKGKKVVLVNPQESKGGLVALALAAARPDIPFVFYEAWSGDISDIRERARKAGNIEWRSPVLDHREIYEDARIVLMPSQAEEAWGMVASEAHCSGIPVVGSDIGGLVESIGSGGIRVSPAAPLGAWVSALGQVWDSPSEWARLSQAARAYAGRPEIQFDHQIASLDACITAHVRHTSVTLKGGGGNDLRVVSGFSG
jgi:glycosyltransferase involved in cell wall biosynthesis